VAWRIVNTTSSRSCLHHAISHAIVSSLILLGDRWKYMVKGIVKVTCCNTKSVLFWIRVCQILLQYCQTSQLLATGRHSRHHCSHWSVERLQMSSRIMSGPSLILLNLARKFFENGSTVLGTWQWKHVQQFVQRPLIMLNARGTSDKATGDACLFVLASKE